MCSRLAGRQTEKLFRMRGNTRGLAASHAASQPASSTSDSLDRLFPRSNCSYTAKNLAAAHRLTALFGMDDLVWNHISARDDTGNILITPGELCFEEIEPEDMVLTSAAKNETGDVIHSAIYACREDVQAVMHAHTPAIVAVSALQDGFKFIDQNSGQFFGGIGYHNYEGMSDDRSEQARIGAALGPDNIVLFMRNHGGVTVGRTVAEAWVRMYYVSIHCTRTRAVHQGCSQRYREKGCSEICRQKGSSHLSLVNSPRLQKQGCEDEVS
jgi:ribulose-5-phosphate 4-epimerase/fuculose-1-phosphate aldolase